MGYNSTILILNDGLDDIERDLPAWWESVKRKILSMDTEQRGHADGHYGLGDVGAGCHANCSTVLACHHADEVVVMAVGGNHASFLGSVYNGGKHSDPKDQLDILKRLADKRGYRLVKKHSNGI